MPWLTSILKWLAPFLLDKFKDWFLQWYEKQRLAKKKATETSEAAEDINKTVIDAAKPEMTDQERLDAQSKAWRKYTDWFGRKRL